MATYLGIDIGTSSVKLTAIDENGAPVATAGASYPIEEPQPGWRQIDPLVWWRAVCAACHELASSTPLDSIAGVGVTGQMHTIVQIDENGVPACPSIMWNDMRTLGEVERAKRALEAAGVPAIAKRVSTGSPALNLAWSRDHDPSAFERTSTFIGVPDWVALKLGAAPAIDWCGASTSSLFDIPSQSWSHQALAALGIPKELLPSIEDADCVAGMVSAGAAEETGLPEGAPIVRGTGDNPAAAIPTCCFGDRVPVISIGTSGVLMFACEGLVEPRYGKPVLLRAAEGMRTLVQLSLRSCGSNKAWFDRSILQAENFDFEDPRVADLGYDMRGLYFYPHLNGEKVLHGNPSIRGAFVGLDLDVSRSELRRAVMEGAAFALRCLRDSVEQSTGWSRVRLVGGGSKSDLWTQIIANVMDVPVERLETSGAGQGAAMLACAAVTGEPLDSIAHRSLQVLDVVEPVPEMVERYAGRFETYQRIDGLIGELYG